MKILFMGTPDFAEGVLKSIYESGRHEITCVVTQPDRPKGRSGQLVASPVKEYALAHNIPVFQPEKIKKEDAVNELKKYQADIFVVAAFGQILSKEILDMPRYGCVNVHASLLPEYRGAAPIQWSIADGKKETGVTIMQMNEGLDTGDILTQKIVEIDAKETGQSLFDKLMEAGGKLIVDSLKLIEEGKVNPVPQEEDMATYAKILKKEMGCIDYSLSADRIDCMIRAFTPWPGGFTYLDGKSVKVKEAYPVMELEDIDISGFQPGQVVKITKDEIYVLCGSGALVLTNIQPEGKKAMSVHDFLLGKKIELGKNFG